MSATARLAFIGAVGVLWLTSALTAATIDVPGNVQTIQEAIDLAQDGDAIVVGPGIYCETLSIVSKSIELRSEEGADSTIIDADAVGTVITCIDVPSSTVIEGFTLFHGSAPSGGGMTLFDSSPVIQFCTFRLNAATENDGAGMALFGSSPTVRYCSFIGNVAEGRGGAISNSDGSAPFIKGCMLRDNVARLGGGIANDHSDPVIEDSHILWNIALQEGGGMYNLASSPSISGGYFMYNAADDGHDGMLNFGGGISNVAGSFPVLEMVTVKLNFACDYGGGMASRGGSSPVVYDCEFYHNDTFGDGGAIFNLATDESDEPNIVGCTFEFNFAGHEGGAIFNWDSSPNIFACLFAWNEVLHSGGAIRNYGDSTPVVWWCTLTGNSASMGGGIANWIGSDALIYDCLFEENFADFHGGGMYNFGCRPEIRESLFIDNEALTGGAMFNRTGAEPAVIGSFFIGNVAGDALLGFGFGGAMRNFDLASPALLNCVFRDNHSITHGGAMSNEVGSTPAITNCVFTRNHAAVHGGALFNDESDPVLTNCTLHANRAFLGAAMCNESGSDPVLANSIIWTDASDMYMCAQVANLDGSPVFSHCNIHGCQDPAGQWIPAIGIDAGGNMELDPRFDGSNLQLSADSPCIDMADAAALPADEFDLDGDGDTLEPLPIDLDGRFRVMDGNGDGVRHPDVGAYEQRPPSKKRPSWGATGPDG